MDTKEHLIQTLEHFRKQRNAKIQEARSLDAIIRSLEQELGNSSSSFGIYGTQPAVWKPRQRPVLTGDCRK